MVRLKIFCAHTLQVSSLQNQFPWISLHILSHLVLLSTTVGTLITPFYKGGIG